MPLCNVPKKSFYLYFALLLAVSFLSGTANAAPHIIATIKPIYALVSGVTEGVVEPDLLIRNASPHSYSLRPKDAAALQRADIIVMVGNNFEVFLDKPLAHSQATIIELMKLEGIKTLPIRKEHIWDDDEEEGEEHSHHHSGTLDTHIWLNPQNAIVIVTKIADILAVKDPGNAAIYRKNAANMTDEIRQLDKELDESLKPYRAVPYLVSHDAYHYFEEHYHLNGVGAITLTPDQTPGIKTIRKLQAAVTRDKVVCLYSEPNFPESFIKIIADNTGVATGVLDAEWGITEEGKGKSSYFSLMRALGRNMIDCSNKKARQSLVFEKIYGATQSSQPEVFVFSRSDCLPCMKEMTLIPALAEAHKNLHIKIIALEDKEHAQTSISHKIPSNVSLFSLRDGHKAGDDTKILQAFGNQHLTLPYSVMMKNDILCAKHYGILTSGTLDSWEKTC